MTAVPSAGASERTAEAAAKIRALFDRVGARVSLYVAPIGGSGNRAAVDVDADEPVAVASVVKIVIALAFCRAVDDGTIDPTVPVDVPARYRIGGTGTAGCVDPVRMSRRDLAVSMMSVSDNAATDVLYELVGQAALDRVVAELGLLHTHVRGGMEWGHLGVVEELRLSDPRDLDDQLHAAGDAVWELAWLDPARANASTPREIGSLLEAIWTDHAGTPAACAAARGLLSHQVSTARLPAGFDDDAITIASKTGTLPSIRNDAGVIIYPDGRQYVTAVFTRARTLTDRQPAIDAAIGRAARIAIDALRADDPSVRATGS